MINPRNCLGRNDNPNAVEFASAFKKLLVCHPLITSVDHNVLTNATGILTVSAHRNNQPSSTVVDCQMPALELDYETIMLIEIERADSYEQHLWAYIALCVEENFIKIQEVISTNVGNAPTSYYLELIGSMMNFLQ